MNSLIASIRNVKPLRTSLHGSDRWLMLAVVMLLLSGTVAIHSTTITNLSGGVASRYLVRHLFYICAGVCLMALIWRYVSLRTLREHSLILALLTILTLLLPLIPFIGVSSKGAARWINFGIFNLQPVEYVKPLVLIYLCSYCATNRESLANIKGLIWPVLLVAVACAFLLLQPDLGSALILTSLLVLVFFLAGVSLRIVSGCCCLATVGLVLAIFFEPYRWRRFVSFLDPFADPYGNGYQQTHALMAFGKGSWFGKGLGQSVEKWSHLPDAHTDFIIAVIAEEMGIVGFALLLGIYALMLQRSFAIAELAEKSGKVFNALLARGIGLMLIGQMTINIASNLALGPVKGLTLPLVSYGGSSLLSWLAILTILQILAHDSYSVSGRSDAKLAIT